VRPWADTWTLGGSSHAFGAGDLLPLDTVASRCGKPLEWALSRTRLLPVIVRDDGCFVHASDLRDWLRAATEEVELRDG
jgi:hypothetical protein